MWWSGLQEYDRKKTELPSNKPTTTKIKTQQMATLKQ